MDLASLITIISAMGGYEAVKYFINRKTNKRKEEAQASSMEIDNCIKQIERYEHRLSNRDAKVDAIYIELRKSQEDFLSLKDKYNASQLEKKILEFQRCEVRGCEKRLPPSEF